MPDDATLLGPLKSNEGDTELLAWLKQVKKQRIPIEGLNLSYTKVTDAGVPVLAEYCPQLQMLNLNGTQVTDAGVVALAQHYPQLDTLGLWGCNKVTDAGVSALAQHCPQLKALGLGYCKEVTDAGVSALAQHCHHLQMLYLGGTQVTDAVVPVLARHCPQLQSLNLTDTQVQSVDEATLQSAKAQEIFAAILCGTALPIVRILFVGTGNIGKSFLFERCFLDRIMDPKFRRETPDIELIRPEKCQWSPTFADKTKLEPRVWDFGGQLVKHGVHETFLGDDGRTIYILVASANASPGSRYDDKDEETANTIAYWLRMIHHFGGSTAPVIVAVTQCDRVPRGNRPLDVAFPPLAKPLCDLSPDELAEPFKVAVTRIVDDLSACDSSRSIQPLRDAINAAVEQRSGIRERKVSRELFAVRERVEKELPQQSLVSVDTFREWCVACNVPEADRQDTLRGILHHMGSLFYFGADREPEDRHRDDLAPGRRRYLRLLPDAILSEFIINPAWLKQAVYQVFEESKTSEWLAPEVVRAKVNAADREVKKANPQFVPHAKGGVVVEAFLKLVELSHFDLEKQAYLFPRGLRRGYSGYTNWPTAWLQWEFAPESAFHRFMVRMHGQQAVVRKNGSEGSYNHGRDWVELQLACNVMVSLDVDTITLHFDPASDRDARRRVYDRVRDDFAGEFISKPPTDESGAEPPPPPPPDVVALRKQISEAKASEWVSLAEASKLSGRPEATLKTYTQASRAKEPPALHLGDAGRTRDGHVWKRVNGELSFLRSSLVATK